MRCLVTRYLPSPAMVVACTALAVALGGTGYAALKLPRNSVGTKQLKNSAVTNRKLARGAVTGSKVARNSLTGTQIDAATLGTVPSATHASSADNATTATTAQNLATPSGFRTVGAPGEPAIQSTWQNSSDIYEYPLGFYKDHEGFVHLRGSVINGIPNNVIFQLPPGYRPASGRYEVVPAACQCTDAQTTNVTIDGSGFGPNADGSVTMKSGSGNLVPGNLLWLDGISFLAES